MFRNTFSDARVSCPVRILFFQHMLENITFLLLSAEEKEKKAISCGTEGATIRPQMGKTCGKTTVTAFAREKA